MNNNITKAVRQTVKFTEGLEVDGYMLPSGEFRVGKTGASVAVGFRKEYLGRLEKTSPSQFKALQNKGFTGCIQSIEVNNERGASRAETLSLTDFRKLISFASSKGKPQAQALVDALLDVGLEDWFRLSFGLNQQTLEEKQAKFDKSYIDSIKWLEEDRQEIKVITETDDRFLTLDYANWSMSF